MKCVKHSVLIKINYVLQRVAEKDRHDEKIGVVLSGCGVYDGSEIHEAVITLLALAREGLKSFASRQTKIRLMSLII